MKRIWCVLLAAVLLSSLTGCKGTPAVSETGTSAPEPSFTEGIFAPLEDLQSYFALSREQMEAYFGSLG